VINDAASFPQPCFDLVTKLNYAVQRSTSITPKILLESEQVVCNEKFPRQSRAARPSYINNVDRFVRERASGQREIKKSPTYLAVRGCKVRGAGHSQG
jgi:hypothetical protein